ncbi:MAG: hypothetical protein SPD85_05645 [Candidatus Cryptobacteroides sp.]|nr:hypothetical protein [Candidatus Cryptobacteroides sp.]
MKTRFFAAVLFFAALASCTKEPSFNNPTTSPDGELMSFTVQAIDTKTVLAESKKTYWSGSESISIFDGTSNNEFTAKLSEPAASATFTGTAATADTYVALYPYNASATLSSQVISTVIPTSQVAVKDTFDPSSAILVGSSSDANMKLTNVCSLLKITVPDGVTSIEVEGNGTAIAGNVSIDLANGNAVSGATETKVTLSKANASVFEKGTYYVAVAPGTLNGVTVTLRDAVNKKHMTRKVESSRTLKGNVIYDMGEFGVVTDVKYIYTDSFDMGETWITKTLTESTESPATGTKCLKWVYDHTGTWNVAAIGLSNIDLKTVSNPSNAYLVYKFRLGVDNGPSTGWEIFRTYFTTTTNEDLQVGKRTVGRPVAERQSGADQFEYIVKDNDWHELRISLADAIGTLVTKNNTITALAFSDMGHENNHIGTTIYFDDIRLVGCGFETAGDVWVNDDATPEPEPEDVKYLYTDSFNLECNWFSDTLTESTESPATGTKCLKWVYDHTGTWNSCTFSLPYLDLKNVENTEGASLVFKFRVADDKGPSENWVIFQPYFTTDNGDVIVHGFENSRGVGRSVAAENQFDFIVNDDQWHELTLPLSIEIQSLKDKSALITGLAFSSMNEGANAGTVIYFDDIRLVGCGLNK